MFKKEYLPTYLKYALLAALVYCIPMFVFVNKQDYHNTWLLYLGNGLFLLSIVFFMLTFNRRKGENASTQTMIAAGHIVTAFGIGISLIVMLLTLFITVPQLLSSNTANDVMTDAPASTGNGETHGMVFILLMNTIIGNLAFGSFASIILPYTAKRDQTKDRKSEVLNN